MRALALALALAGLSGTAAAEPAGEILFLRDGTLHRRAPDKAATATPVAAHGLPDPVDRMSISADGRVVVISAGARHRWLDPTAPEPRWRALPCASPPIPDADGERVACASGTDFAFVHDLRTGARRAVAAAGDNARPVGDRLVAASGDAVIAVDLATRAVTPLAPHRPTEQLSIAPDGSRAVGTYPPAPDEKTPEPALVSFRLDGTAARRRLLGHGVPVAWSADGRWLAVQQLDRACIVRPVGGQYKCWRRYRAVGIAPDGSWLLVTRPNDDGGFDLYRAELAGARASRPTRLEEKIDGPAVWAITSP